LSILQGNSRSITQKSGEIWTVQSDLQQIYPMSDRLLGFPVATHSSPVKPEKRKKAPHPSLGTVGAFANTLCLLQTFCLGVLLSIWRAKDTHISISASYKTTTHSPDTFVSPKCLFFSQRFFLTQTSAAQNRLKIPAPDAQVM